ncbi:hypothetical protein CPB84DRAFT_1762525 [Gymnopilus junonius]|uniref:Uncharacterized protein n=1 Tax=Gymnopilus junonius TaxID=109634 RepID=A0A9P5NZF3_GYMJU|nr:hypothetical protein CPB84DRAFT_1762525 [Gymnopilus junonius]
MESTEQKATTPPVPPKVKIQEQKEAQPKGKKTRGQQQPQTPQTPKTAQPPPPPAHSTTTKPTPTTEASETTHPKLPAPLVGAEEETKTKTATATKKLASNVGEEAQRRSETAAAVDRQQSEAEKGAKEDLSAGKNGNGAVTGTGGDGVTKTEIAGGAAAKQATEPTAEVIYFTSSASATDAKTGSAPSSTTSTEPLIPLPDATPFPPLAFDRQVSGFGRSPTSLFGQPTFEDSTKTWNFLEF